jgi:ketosteroid isomerase-like protein
MSFRRLIAAAVLLAIPSASLAAQAPAPGAAAATANDPRAAADGFVAALNGLDGAALEALFADDVTLFLPSAPFPLRRVEGKAEAMLWFNRFFDALRRRGGTRGSITPRDLEIQDYGDAAIASFHLQGGGNIGRRTLVLRRDRGRWQIVHLHASAEPEQPPAA